MTKTIGEAHKELKELERNGLLKEQLQQLIRSQEERLVMKHFGIPRFIVTMYVHNKPSYENGKIILQYWDEEYLYHELGHFYLDELRKELGLDLHTNKGEINKWWEARDKLINEGVATYFEQEMSVDGDDFSDAEYPRNIEAFLRNDFHFLLRLYYEGCYHLVKPILDEYGVKEGCKKIVLDLPKKEEMIKLPAYRKRILDKSVY